MKFRLFSIPINLNGYNGHNGIETTNVINEISGHDSYPFKLYKNRYII